MPGSSRYRASPTDGRPCRVSGAWAKEKLHYLAAYMRIFNVGMKNLWPHRAYVDLMAGPGRCILDGSAEEFDGSPLLALACSPEFEKVILLESDPQVAAALRSRVAVAGERAKVIIGDCNAPETIAAIRREVPSAALTLAFADMLGLLGLEVEFATLKQLTSSRKVDLAITFQVNDLTRNVPQILQGHGNPDRLDRFFGTQDWLPWVQQRTTTHRPIADVLADFYIERLRTIGYDHVAPLHVLMKNQTNAPLYRLILAGKHERAAEFFTKISKIEYSGQRGLF